ncbi:MAG: alpha-amylase family glycosyl hydrolase [Ruminococcus sp.]
MTDVRDLIFYHIYPLGFCGAPERNGFSEPRNRLEKIEKWIPHMKSLGINALYLGPVFQSLVHGYDTFDYRLIDSRLGTNDDFKCLCKSLKDNGIKIILDGVFNHVGRGFFAFEDVLRNREASPYCSWISSLRFDMNNSKGDNLHYDSWAGFESLVKLNLKNPDVKEYLLSSVDMWIDEFGIDGLRLDAADCIDRDFFIELRRRTEAKRPDFWLMGEIIHGNYCNWANSEMLHSVTNYECYAGIHSAINSKNMFEISHSINRQYGEWGIYKDIALYNFVDNHDVARLASVMKGSRQNLKNAYTILFAMPGVPSIYYGSEWGIEGEKQKHTDAPLRPAVDVEKPDIRDRELLEHLKELASVRKESKALKYGSFRQVQIGSEYLVFERKFEDDTRFVFINISTNEMTLQGDFEGKNYREVLPAYSSRIVKI